MSTNINSEVKTQGTPSLTIVDDVTTAVNVDAQLEAAEHDHKMSPEEAKQKFMDFHAENLKSTVFFEPTIKALEAALKLHKNIILHGPGGHNKSLGVIDFLGSKGIRPYVITMGQGMNTDRLFGGIDIKTMNETGKLEYLVENSFMNHEYVIFEEMLDAMPHILEQLKDILSSGVFRNGSQFYPIKTRMIICCTNRTRSEFSKDNSLKALMERFPYEWEVKWKEYNEITYTKLFQEKLGGVDPMLPFLLQEYAKDGKIISPRIALLAAETLEELGPDYLNVIADFNEKPELLRTTIAKFTEKAGLRKVIEKVRDILTAVNQKESTLNENMSLVELEEVNTINNSLSEALKELGKIKVPDDSVATVAEITKVARVVVTNIETKINDIKTKIQKA